MLLTKIRLKVTVFQDQWDFSVVFSFTLIVKYLYIFDSLFLDVFEALTQFSIDSIDIQKKTFLFYSPADGNSHLGANLLTFIMFQIWFSPLHKKCRHSAIKA